MGVLPKDYFTHSFFIDGVRVFGSDLIVSLVFTQKKLRYRNLKDPKFPASISRTGPAFQSHSLR